MRRLLTGLLAATLLATTVWVGGTGTARASYATDRNALCGPGNTNACSIDVVNDAVYELTEGVDSARITVTGSPGVSGSIQMYALRPSPDGNGFDTSRVFGAAVPFTTDSLGRAKPDVPIAPLAAPFGADSYIVFQLADAGLNDLRNEAIGPIHHLGLAEKIHVRSRRGARGNNGPVRVIDGSLEAKVSGGITGHVYGAQILIGGTWNTIEYLDVDDNGTVDADGYAVVHGDVSDYPDGTYTTRLFNASESTYTLQASVRQNTLVIAKSIYVTPGEHESSGRRWRTTCEPYSQTERCRTEIWATTVENQGGRIVKRTGWAFNNLTYKPSKRELWAENPLGNEGNYVLDGRKWRTECDTATTGRNGCRSYIVATVVESIPSGSGYRYRLVTKEVFNNIVLFSVPERL